MSPLKDGTRRKKEREGVLMQFKGMLYILYLPISQLARNMGLISAVKNTMSILYTLFGSTLWILVRIIVKPVSLIQKGVPSMSDALRLTFVAPKRPPSDSALIMVSSKLSDSIMR